MSTASMDVHHAVGCSIVSSGHLRYTVDLYAGSGRCSDVKRIALARLDHLLGLEVLREDSSASNDVVLQHSLKLLDVLGIEQVREGSCRHLGEALVGGRKDGERVPTHR